MSISGMSDLLETPEGLDSLDGALTEDLIGEQDEQDEDASLLDAALGDVSTGDKDSAITPTDEHGDNILDDTNDNVQVEEDPEIEAIKARVKEMEEEAEKLKEMQGEVEKQMMSTKSATTFPTPEEKQEADIRSVYVGNVDYQSTAEELGQHFQSCGAINRVTILCDKYTGHPKGFAYVEFVDKGSVTQALELDESLFKGRQIKVSAKRTNRPGLTARGRGRGRGRGIRGGYNPYMGGMMMMPMPPMGGYYRGGRGRAFRGRAKTWYAPY